MKKRLVAILASLITVIGTLAAVPAASADELSYIKYSYVDCDGGYFSIKAHYVNSDTVEQSLGLLLDGVMIDGPYVLAPGSQLDAGAYLTKWKPKLKSVSELSMVRNGVTFGTPVLIDLVDCYAPFAPKWHNIVPPKITGACSPGKTVRANTGKWSKSSLNFGYRWYYGRDTNFGYWYYDWKGNGWPSDIVAGAYGKKFNIPKSFKKGYTLTLRLVVGTSDVVVWETTASCVLK